MDILLTCIRGEAWPRVPPPPPRAERRLGYPRANFFYFSKQIFYFFLPIPITSPIYPFFLSLRGFLFLCVYFLSVYLFVSLRAKNGENKNCISYPILCLCGYYTPYSHSLLFSYAVFFPCISLLFSYAVLCFCIVFCCGCCVFR